MRTVFRATISAAIVVAGAAPAAAKVVGTAHIEGPGLQQAVVVGHRDVVAFPEIAGLFGDATTVGEPDERGARYTMTFELEWPRGWRTVQYLYPYSSEGPVVFTPRGQRLFHGEQGVVPSGWARATPELMGLLERRGLPPDPSAAGVAASRAPTAPAPDESARIPWAVLALGGMLIVGATLEVRSRRSGPAPAG